MSLSLYSQVGINTSNPLQIFHVDGTGNNGSTELENLTETQQADDVVITKDGRIGIGTADPTARIEIKRVKNEGAIKIADGAGDGKVLTSDENGVASWVNPGVRLVEGNTPKTQIWLAGSPNGNYIGANITLPKGQWLVYIGMLIGGANQPNRTYATRFLLSNSETSFYSPTTDEDFDKVGYNFIGTNTILNQRANGAMTDGTSSDTLGFYGMFSSGLIRVEVTSEKAVPLFLWDVDSINYGNRTGKQFVRNNGENYIFAIATN